MGTIYSNSFLSIGADWGSEVSSGLFNRDSDKQLEDQDGMTRITSRLSDGLESTLYFDGPLKFDIFEIQDAVLNTRVWAYQERLISPRILHFTEGQLFWECKKVLEVKDGLDRLCGEIYPCPAFTGRCLDLSSLSRGANDLIHTWYMYLMSQNYAARRLTVLSDKLPAISALAKVWAHHLKAPYLAGLWHYQLPWGLSWCRLGRLKPKPKDYRAPSWSWASLNCDVEWDFGGLIISHVDKSVTTEEACVSLIGHNRFGEVDGGRVTVFGLVQQFRVVSCDGTTTRSTTSNERVGIAHMDINTESHTVQGLLLLSWKQSPDSFDAGFYCWSLS